MAKRNPLRARHPQATTRRPPRPRLELLEDRTLLDAGQWLVHLVGLPGDTRAVQMAAAQTLVHQAGLDSPPPGFFPISVIDHVGTDGIVLIQTSPDASQTRLDLELRLVRGYDYIENYDPEQDPTTRRSWFQAFETPAPIPPGGSVSSPPGGNGNNGGSPPPGGPLIPPIGPNTVTPVNGFNGLNSNQTSCGCQPPDTIGAAGPSSYIETVNTALAIYNKTTGSITLGPTEFSTFFAPLGGTLQFSDPVVQYDDIHQRFVVGILDFNTSSSARFDFAVSKSSNPASFTAADWNFYRYNANDGTGGFDFPDYPKIGYNADGYYVSFNMFPNLGFFDHVNVLAITSSDPTVFHYGAVPGGFNNFTLAPATMHGSVPGDPEWFVEDGAQGGAGSSVTVVKMANPTSASPAWTMTALGVSSYTAPPRAVEPGGGTIDTLDARFYFSASRNGQFVAAHTVGTAGVARVRWFDFDITGAAPTISQQGEINQGSGVYTYLPSMDINAANNIALNFSQSSSTQNWSMYVTGRGPGEPLGTMETPILARAGTGTSPDSRAGDYSFVNVDPTDGSFWAANEYGTASPFWSTWIEHFTVVTGPTAPIVGSVSPNSGPLAGGNTVTISGSSFTGATAVTFGAVAASSFTVVNDTTITAVAPAESAGTVDVTVTNAIGTSPASAADRYTYLAAPAVTGVSPASGPAAGGTVVTITGTGFTAGSTVRFGAAASGTVTFVSATQLTAVTPAGAPGTVDVTVSTPGGTSAITPADQYSYVAAPTITGVSPTSGPTGGGNPVTITGTGFTGATAVLFGGVSASFTFVSDTTITATAPAHAAATVDVTVTAVGGTSATSAADHYTYVLAPAVAGVSPTFGPAAGGNTVTITGSGFTGATAVKFGSVAAGSFTVVSDTSITAVAPAESAGTVDVTVTNAVGTSPVNPADRYTFVAPGTPLVTSVTPTVGPTAGGNTVTISGSSFTGATAVLFGGVAAGFTVNSDGSITATAPAESAGTVDVTVTNAIGTSPASAADRYTYLAAPAVTGVSPASGPAAGGTVVTITGTGFTAGSTVRFGAAASGTVTFVSATQLTAVAPAGAPGTVDVTVSTPGGTSAITPADQYTYSAFPSIGPDGFGYIASSGPVVPFVELVGDPSAFSVINFADDSSVAVNLGTNKFNFYGQVYTGNNQLFVSSNGLISFGRADSSYLPANLTTSPSEPVIAPLWADWIKNSGTPMVLGRIAGNQLILEWNQVQTYPGNGSYTFEAILSLNTSGTNTASFSVVYKAFSGPLTFSHTVGSKGAGTQPNNLSGFRILVENNTPTAFVQPGQSLTWTAPPYGATITGTVYQDLNHNGTRDSGEPGLPNWAVFVDANNNGVLDPGELSAVSGSDGSYSITGVSPGTAILREVPQSNWARSQPGAPGYYTLTVGVRQTVTGKNFGDYPLGTTTVVDNSDPGFATTGSDWATQTSGYNNNSVSHLLVGQPIAGPDGFTYQAVTAPFQNLELAGDPSAFTIISSADDLSVPVDLGGHVFTFYGQKYTGNNQLFVSSNGLISFGVADSSFSPSNLTSSPNELAIAPLWNDWIGGPGTPMVLGKFDAANDELIIEWNKIRHYPGTSGAGITFQAILHLDDTGPYASDIVFNYVNLTGVPGFDEGAGSTVGVKATGFQGPFRLQVSSAGQAVASGKAVRITIDPVSQNPGTASWAFPVAAHGAYDLFATWVAAAGNATNAQYHIYDGTTLLGTVAVDQTQAPSSALVNGSLWDRLGTFTSATGVFTIVLDTNLSNGAISADAVFAASTGGSTSSPHSLQAAPAGGASRGSGALGGGETGSLLRQQASLLLTGGRAEGATNGPSSSPATATGGGEAGTDLAALDALLGVAEPSESLLSAGMLRRSLPINGAFIDLLHDPLMEELLDGLTPVG